MRRLISICLAIFVTCVSAQDSRADADSFVTANAYDAESGDGNSQNNPKAASANYSNPNGGGASAFANQDPLIVNNKFYLSLHAFATATGGSGDDGQFVSNRGTASSSWEDDLSFALDPTGSVEPPFPDYLQFMFRMSGSSSGDATGQFSFVTTDAATGDPIIQTRDPDAFDADFKDVPFLLHFSDDWDQTSFQHIGLSLSVSATGHGSGLGGPTTSTADYSHTITLVSITPYDANGNIVPGFRINSASGFDYNAAVVPEPSSLALLGLAAIALLAARRFVPSA